MTQHEQTKLLDAAGRVHRLNAGRIVGMLRRWPHSRWKVALVRVLAALEESRQPRPRLEVVEALGAWAVAGRAVDGRAVAGQAVAGRAVGRLDSQAVGQSDGQAEGGAE